MGICSSVIQISLLNGSSNLTFLSFCFIQRTHWAIKPWGPAATKVLEGLTLKASGRNDFCKVVDFFRYDFTWKLLCDCRKAITISNNLYPGTKRGRAVSGSGQREWHFQCQQRRKTNWQIRSTSEAINMVDKVCIIISNRALTIMRTKTIPLWKSSLPITHCRINN